METNCELLWCKVGIQGTKQLLIGAYYRPKEEEADSLEELEASLDRLGNRDDHFLLGGDFNFPGWDWESKQLTEKCRYLTLHLKFGEILDDRNLVQVVEKPTRE